MGLFSRINFWMGRKRTRPVGSEQHRLAIPGTGRKISGTWYRGQQANFYPKRVNLSKPDAIARYICQGWLPPRPMIDRQKYITAFGSCFAREVTNFLFNEGYRVFGRDLTLNSHIVRSGDGIVNTAALRQQFEWAFNDWIPSGVVWHNATGEPAAATEATKQSTLQIFQETDVFIFTLGLSEVWYDKTTGDTFWRAIPQNAFDETRHGFRVLTVEENKQNLAKVYEIIRTNRPEAEIIITLSPIPLAATFRPVSCITANSVSKASLRVAIDELMRERGDDRKLHYFPSYEIATTAFPDPHRRHPKPRVVRTIMKTFKQAYLT